MGLGDILGSLSPAYGLMSGQGLGSYLKYLSPAYDMYSLGSGGHQSAPVASTPSSVGVAGQQPLAQIGGHDLASASSALPGMAGQNPFAMIGNALLQAHKGQQQQAPVELSSNPAYAAPLAPVDSSMLSQLLGSIGQRRAS